MCVYKLLCYSIYHHFFSQIRSQSRPSARIAWLGGRNKFWGAREVYFVWIREGHGGTRNYPSLDQMNKVRNKDSKEFSGRKRKFKRFFRPITGVLRKKKVFTEISRDFPAEIAKSSGFSGRMQVISKKQKVFIPKTSRYPVSVHKKHQCGARFALQKPQAC